MTGYDFLSLAADAPPLWVGEITGAIRTREGFCHKDNRHLVHNSGRCHHPLPAVLAIMHNAMPAGATKMTKLPLFFIHNFIQRLRSQMNEQE